MKIIFPHEVPVPAGCAPDSCYYISYQKPLVYNADGELISCSSYQGGLTPTTIVTDLRRFLAMENGKACPGSLPTLPGTLGALLYTHVYWQ